MTGNIIETYLARTSAQHRYLLSNQALETRNESLRLVRARYEAGAADALQVEEATGLVQEATAVLERTDREFRQAGNALALLIGQKDAHALLPRAPAELHSIVSSVQPGLPSAVLAQRPDVLAAEHRLRAENANIGAARAAFFPRISLTGFLGSASTELSDLFTQSQRAWTFSPSLSIPLFDGGGRKAALDLAHVRKESAVVAYEKSIQVAFLEVSDALAAIDTLGREERAREALAQSSSKSRELSEARYRAGLDDNLVFLDAQRREFSAQLQLIEVRTQRQAAAAQLFRALGGGWSAVSAQTSRTALQAQ